MVARRCGAVARGFAVARGDLAAAGGECAEGESAGRPRLVQTSSAVDINKPKPYFGGGRLELTFYMINITMFGNS